MQWALTEIAKHSPLTRLELIREARAHKLIRNDAVGLTSLVVALKRLRARGCVQFDELTAIWTGRALPVKAISATATARFRRLAAGRAETFAILRQEELERLQRERDVGLAALRAPGAPMIDPSAYGPWKPAKRLRLTPKMTVVLEAYLNSPANHRLADRGD